MFRRYIEFRREFSLWWTYVRDEIRPPNPDTYPGALPPDNGTLKAAKKTGTYASRISRKAKR